MIEQIYEKLGEKLRYAGKRSEPEEWVMHTLVFSGGAAIAVLFVLYIMYDVRIALLMGLILFVAALIIRYILLEMEIERRKREVERVLPDLLRVVAANISAGLTPIVALRTAARPEFGTISKELKYITARSMSAESMDEIVGEIKTRIRSDLLARVLMVFTTSLKSGGNVIHALEGSASDIQRLQELQESLAARTSMYTTFVLFGILVTMPFLLAVSMNVLELMGGVSAARQLSYVSAYMNLGFPTISSVFITIISAIILVGSSLTASMLIGIIRAGSRIEGLKYFLPLMTASLGVFYLSKDIVVPFIIGILK